MITAIGLTSGASMQGVEVALVATDGERRIVRKESLTFPYSPEQRTRLGAAFAREHLLEAERELTRLCADAVKQFLENVALARDAVALIGFHAPDAAEVPLRASELERGEELARATGIDVVYDFGAADREAGGQGRPLEPVYHRALAEVAGLARPLAVIEIGDDVTVTFIGEDGSLAVASAGRKATAEAIAKVRKSLPALPLLWLLAGEERQSAALLEALGGLVPEPVHRAADMGWPADHFEAEAFAYLAVRSVRRLPLTFPGTTGVRQPLTGGRLARAPRR
jgi:1,6-anhydro-N-acetylmuramate kinase